MSNKTDVIKNYRLVQVPSGPYQLPFLIQKKFFGFWFTVNSYYSRDKAIEEFDIYCNHKRRKVIDEK